MSTKLLAQAEIARLVEKQLRNWELARTQAAPTPGEATPMPVRPFVALSREVGCDAGPVAERLAARLGWPLFDRELLSAMAADDGARNRLLTEFDERDENWLREMLRWALEGEFVVNEYFHRLTETVLRLARRGPAVFVGRGVDLLLPQECGLRVRLIAPEEARIAMLSVREQLSHEAARAELHRRAAERDRFVQSHFRRRDGDIARHDLLINVERVSAETAADIIAAALRSRGLTH